MPEIPSEMGDPAPRTESPGEAQQRYASTMSMAGHKLNLPLTFNDYLEIAKLVAQLMEQLTPEGKLALIKFFAQLVEAWLLKRNLEGESK